MNRIGATGTIRSWLQLGKITISIPVALTGFLGYFRATGRLDTGTIPVILGILFLAIGASTFNQVQEAKTDSLMNRTRNRPLPSGKISRSAAILFGTLASITGTALLFLTHSIMAPVLGIFTLFWYNAVYTPLKKITPFAVLPGALIGALPPMIGWTAAGESLAEKEIILIGFFLFIGQMPHYWLLLMKIGEEFKTAGLPVITDIFNPHQLRLINFTWIFAAAVSVVMFPALNIIHNNLLAFVLLGVIILFLARMFILTFRGEFLKNWKKAFVTVNIFYLLIILLLIADKLAEPYIYNNITYQNQIL